MKINKRMMKALCCLLFFVLPGTTVQTPLKYQKFPDLKYQIIRLPDHTFGYQILNKNQVFIDQPFVPGLPGRTGFKTEVRASTMARLVISKIQQGEIPPTVSIEEMKKLKVID
ncbi:DUF4907 domain-containing protein [Flavihumibacter sp. R14]|nr:DUF4907 domain-containing protein [Flavihumibacter soli]